MAATEMAPSGYLDTRFNLPHGPIYGQSGRLIGSEYPFSNGSKVEHYMLGGMSRVEFYSPASDTPLITVEEASFRREEEHTVVEGVLRDGSKFRAEVSPDGFGELPVALPKNDVVFPSSNP